MSTAQVPLVTLEDLQSFQAKHFPTSVQAPEPTNESYDDDDEDDDGLGYYPDGVKRTLTDEQIRIFRLSEIHALLRERQIKQENEEYARRVSEQAEAPNSSDQEGLTAEDELAQPGDQTKLDTSAAGVKRPAEEDEKKESVKRQATVPADVSLDYSEEISAQKPAHKQSAPQFAGRRIISYDD
ncbi:hypothetical protein BJX63DRAFT_425910 [Aspergillus granulosus]|uniref:Uncharacterized protein n=1 Tax=Aspergillus granulosus TaxID=176169 RepID=A0ABR4GU92_9EURO